MNAMGSSFDELANSAMAVREAELARVDAIAANVAQTSEIVTGSKNFGAVAEDIGGQAFEDYDDRVAEKANQYIESMDVADKNLDSGEAAEAIKKYANI
jgi:cellulase/cellobiase CelA1